MIGDAFGFDYVYASQALLSAFFWGIWIGFTIGFIRFIFFTWTERRETL